MIVYPDRGVNVAIEDSSDAIINNDTFIYTDNGIYKKYKKHFFLYEINSDTCDYALNGDTFRIENGISVLNKKILLTYIPQKCYYVNRTTIRLQLDSNVIMVKEIDNDVFESIYFIVSDYEIVDSIRLYLK